MYAEAVVTDDEYVCQMEIMMERSLRYHGPAPSSPLSARVKAEPQPHPPPPAPAAQLRCSNRTPREG